MSRSVELRRARPLLGTFVEIRAQAESDAVARAGLTRAFVAVARVQAEMSFHDETSEISRLNRDAFRMPVRVHDWTWQVLAVAQEYALLSGGAFDITIAPLLCRWGFLPAAHESDANGDLPRHRARAGQPRSFPAAARDRSRRDREGLRGRSRGGSVAGGRMPERDGECRRRSADLWRRSAGGASARSARSRPRDRRRLFAEPCARDFRRLFQPEDARRDGGQPADRWENARRRWSRI